MASKLQDTYSFRGLIPSAFPSVFNAANSVGVIDTNLSPDKRNAWEVREVALMATAAEARTSLFYLKDDSDYLEAYLSRVPLTARPELDDPNLIASMRIGCSTAVAGVIGGPRMDPQEIPITTDAPFLVGAAAYIYTFGAGVSTIALRYRVRWAPATLSNDDYYRLLAGS